MRARVSCSSDQESFSTVCSDLSAVRSDLDSLCDLIKTSPDQADRRDSQVSTGRFDSEKVVQDLRDTRHLMKDIEHTVDNFRRHLSLPNGKVMSNESIIGIITTLPMQFLLFRSRVSTPGPVRIQIQQTSKPSGSLSRPPIRIRVQSRRQRIASKGDITSPPQPEGLHLSTRPGVPARQWRVRREPSPSPRNVRIVKTLFLFGRGQEPGTN